jgi:hypothetical protein
MTSAARARRGPNHSGQYSITEIRRDFQMIFFVEDEVTSLHFSLVPEAKPNLQE